MPLTFANFQEGLDSRLQDLAEKISAADKDKALRQAIQQRYSKDRPLLVISDVNGTGTNLVSLPAGGNGEVFEDGFSEIDQIEFPLGENPPQYLEDADFDTYRTPTGLKVILFTSLPGTAEQLRMTWTARHKNDGSTVHDPDLDAVCDYAAALALEQLAASYISTNDPTLQADSVNYRTKSQECLSVAKTFRNRYYQAIGIQEGDNGQGGSGQQAAISIGDVDLTMGWGGDRITHNRSTR